MKKDVDSIEGKLGKYALKKNFEQLQTETRGYAMLKDMNRIKDELKNLDETLEVYARVTYVDDRLTDMEI